MGMPVIIIQNSAGSTKGVPEFCVSASIRAFNGFIVFFPGKNHMRDSAKTGKMQGAAAGTNNDF
jgi:hypothetical protein